jgi:hypothetical protein
MVGIGGGVPSKAADVRLGDIVVSKPIGKFGGVKQYDLGKSIGEVHLKQTGMLNQPPSILLTAASQLESKGMRKQELAILGRHWNCFRKIRTWKRDSLDLQRMIVSSAQPIPIPDQMTLALIVISTR